MGFINYLPSIPSWVGAMHRFLVLHFGGQCPWHLWAIEQVREAADRVGGSVEVVDVMDKPEMAERYRLFFPFMTIIDDTIRLPSPTVAGELVKIVGEGATTKPTVPQPLGPEARAGRIELLTAGNIGDTCPLCVPDSEARGCQAKRFWAARIEGQVPEGILGFISYEGGRAVGVVEYLPSPLVPYPLPEKDPTIAFITCIYSPSNGLGTDQGEGPDYRGQVLDRLLEDLPGQGYKKLQVIAGRRTPYPNGPVPFFLERGFRELGELDRVILKIGEEEIVLMELDLAKC